MFKFVSNFYHNITKNRNLFVDLLVVLFGAGSWAGVNSVFVELPLLVETAPENWNLPAYLSVVIQIANIGPILYSLSRKFWVSKKINVIIISCLLAVSAGSTLLMAFFNDKVMFVAGADRSVPLLIFTFFNGLLGCCSSVLFYPYMGNLKQVYLVTYLIGEGLSGLIPSLVALIQGVGGKPECVTEGDITKPVYPKALFSSMTFFLIISVLMVLSFVSFLLLHNLNVCKREKVEKLDEDPVFSESKTPKLKTSEKVLALIMLPIVCALGNGFLQGIQSYSCLPYGENAYHLSATLGMLANPLACFLAAFLLFNTEISRMILFSIMILFTSYVVTTAGLSPNALFDGATVGIVLIILAWIILLGIIAYLKLCIYTLFRDEGDKWMFYAGSITQIGSCVGGVTSFILVNIAKVFTPKYPCAG